MLKPLAFGLLAMLAVLPVSAQAPADVSDAPLRVGVVGLVHTHVHWILGREDRGDIEIVGIVEPNRDLAERYAAQHGYSMDLVYADLEAMLDAAQPEAVTVFTTIKDHRRVTEVAAGRGVHVMVEKPLAVSLEDAQAMLDAAERGGIHLLTNYETTWYPSVHEAHRLYAEGALGPLRKMVVMDGHFGPEEIGVNEEFLEWLIDPAYNGAGALTDFGCYGANLLTWFMGNQRPLTVTAITQQIKPDRYPLVDDEATIIVTYPEAQGVIQASWNWPYHRKDMEVYGATGAAIATGGQTLRLRPSDPEPWADQALSPLPAPFDDPFSYLEAVVRGRIAPDGDLSSLENNMIVMEILDAAMRSASTGRTVVLSTE